MSVSDAEHPVDETSVNHSSNHSSSDEDALAELRNLLFGVEQRQLRQIQERLEDPKLRAEDLGKVLAEAVVLQTLQENEQLTEAMVPTIESAIQASVKKDLTVIADAIFPVIGPASRRAIATALEATLQSLNQALENSLTPQSFAWRLEALQTGKSFAEVVLLRTLLYRVEQVFLIHKETSLLLHHVAAPGVETLDADLVSAMLKAIQDFVRDSFNTSSGDSLDTLRFGELTIWIEQGPQAVLAGVIRGNAPYELRIVFQQAIEKIHQAQGKALADFQGNAAVFEASHADLEDCLRSRYRHKKQGNTAYAWAAMGVLLLALGIFGFFGFRARQRWATYLEQLKAEPGIVVIEAKRGWRKYFISGLRDPLAVDPDQLLQPVGINPQAVVSQWEPYLSFDSELAATRVKDLLKPPANVSLSLDEDGVLHMSGTAPRAWIAEAQQLAQFIPGVAQVEVSDLIETEVELESIQRQIEDQILQFQEGEAAIAPNQDESLQTLVEQIKRLTTLAAAFNQTVQVEAIGRANNNGSEAQKLALSQSRADAIVALLTSAGIEPESLTAQGIGTSNPLQNQSGISTVEINRSVSFKVSLTDEASSEISNP
jgi:OOP family OmpA-OmpF porin